MSVLQISVALLCLLSLTCAALDTGTKAQINRNLNQMKKDRLDLAKIFLSSRDVTSKLLDQTLKMVERMDDMVHELGIEQKYPYVAEIMEDLKTFLENIKVSTIQQMDKVVKEYEEMENKMQTLVMKFMSDFKMDHSEL
ncbi:hypothetical protein NL108_016796 [Boleophthalmus pectinirostris]|nr:hypothetical protein NL108_016796 [Boleophthalmus pectinirostris]